MRCPAARRSLATILTARRRVDGRQERRYLYLAHRAGEPVEGDNDVYRARRQLQERHGKRVPLLVKVAPDLTSEQISALALDLRSLAVDGVIATNTSTDRSALGNTPAAEQSGGMSGAPLHPSSVRVISQLRAELGTGFPIIGVGGIVSADQALETLRAGADLMQIYTGFAYRGPVLLEEILGALSHD